MSISLHKWRLAVATLVLTAIAQPALIHGAWITIDDFDSYTDGDAIHSKANWTSDDINGGEADIAIDPADADNLVLKFSGNGTDIDTYNSHSAISITNSTTGTLYMRMRFVNANQKFNFGLTDVSAPDDQTQYNLQYRLKDLAGTINLQVRHSTWETVAPLAADTWYETWTVIDNNVDETQFYIRGGIYGTQTELAGPFDFRRGAINTTLDRLYVFTPSNGHDGPLYIDDIHIDTTGENLSSVEPVPLPNALTMGAALILLLWLRSRPRRTRAP